MELRTNCVRYRKSSRWTKMQKILMRLISALVLVVIVFVAVFHFATRDHLILSQSYRSSDGFDAYELSAACKRISLGTIAPYITLRLNGVEILKTMVSPGYDTVNDCTTSSVDHAKFSEKERKIVIVMRGGASKEVGIIYY